MNNEQSPIRHNHPWVGGGPCLVNAVARRLNSGGSWVGGGPCLVNAVARRLNGGGSCPEIYVKMFIFKVDVQSDHLETKCSWVKVSQGKNVTVEVSSGSKCHSGQNVGGRNVKAS
jgi:hypothetical protein